MIYLDNAATTYPKSESVYQALDYANREYAFNAGRGSYEKARIATEIIDTTKKQIKELKLRYGIGDNQERTLEEVGILLNVTIERIRQIESKAMRKLKSSKKIHSLESYL